VGGVNERGRCHRCERWIETDSPSDTLCVACYDWAALDVPYDGGKPAFTPEQWAEIVIDAELRRYHDSARDDEAGEPS
jgi:hypothetical protein